MNRYHPYFKKGRHSPPLPGEKREPGESWFDDVLDRLYQCKKPRRENYPMNFRGFGEFKKEKNRARRERQERAGMR